MQRIAVSQGLNPEVPEMILCSPPVQGRRVRPRRVEGTDAGMDPPRQKPMGDLRTHRTVAVGRMRRGLRPAEHMTRRSVRSDYGPLWGILRLKRA